ncbi:MAG: DNA-processing protein DprA [Candidatus Shapirobacteria bacterium]
MEIKVICKDSDSFPYLLRQIPDCPDRLYCLGNTELLREKKALAVVGSRNISEYGKEVVEKLVPELVRTGIVVVSGMAFGVDAQVQRVCTERGGKTIAVLASGVDVVSPRSNKWLYELILASGGLIVSEYANGVLPAPEKFLARNRIISGISRGVVVIEGSKRSGTLVTARLAAEQGREVWAVPGRMTDTNSAAPNYLIKNGANIVTGIEDLEGL